MTTGLGKKRTKEKSAKKKRGGARLNGQGDGRGKERRNSCVHVGGYRKINNAEGTRWARKWKKRVVEPKFGRDRRGQKGKKKVDCQRGQDLKNKNQNCDKTLEGGA